MFETFQSKASRLSDLDLPEVSTEQTAKTLGWASLAIGLAELVATTQVQNLLGIEDNKQRRGVLRTLGVRELMHGAAILSSDEDDADQLATSMWGRVAGDVLDTALLAKAGKESKHPLRFGAVAALVAGIGLADFLCAQKLSR